MSGPVKIVCVSDAHLDKRTMGVPRLAEGAAALWAAAKHAASLDGVRWFLFLGDLCDPDDDPGATLLAMQEAAIVASFLSRRGVPSIWVAGNHDVDEGGTGATTIGHIVAVADATAPLHEEPNVFVFERPGVVVLAPGLHLLCLPFAPVSHAYDPREAARAASSVSYGKARLAVAAHLSIPGIVPGEETEEMPRGRDMPFPLEETRGAVLRLSGHYHKRQSFDPGDGGVPIQVIGSPLRFTAHDEQSEPGFLVITIP